MPESECSPDLESVVRQFGDAASYSTASTGLEPIVASIYDRLSSYPQAQAESVRGLHELSLANPEEFCLAGLQVCRGSSGSFLARILAYQILASGWLGRLLCRPTFCDDQRAKSLARALASVDSLLDIRLCDELIRLSLEPAIQETTTTAVRIVNLLRAIEPTARVLEPLTVLLQIAGPAVRSKTALLIGDHWPTSQCVTLCLNDPDPRVRANLIESLWGKKIPSLIGILESATRDKNHRVVTNAWLGIYLLGDPRAESVLRSMVSEGNPELRAAAVWALGETGDPCFLPLLETLLEDPEPLVARNARRGLTQIHLRKADQQLKSTQAALSQLARDSAEPSPARGKASGPMGSKAMASE